MRLPRRATLSLMPYRAVVRQVMADNHRRSLAESSPGICTKPSILCASAWAATARVPNGVIKRTIIQVSKVPCSIVSRKQVCRCGLPARYVPVDLEMAEANSNSGLIAEQNAQRDCRPDPCATTLLGAARLLPLRDLSRIEDKRRTQDNLGHAVTNADLPLASSCPRMLA